MTTKQLILVVCCIFIAQGAFSQHYGHGGHGYGGGHHGGYSSHHEYGGGYSSHSAYCHRGPDVRFFPAPRVVVAVAPRQVIYRQDPVYVQQPQYNSSRMVIAQEDFFNIKRTANSMQYEEDKLNFLFGRIENNYFTSDQIADLLYCFSIDQNRLSIARYAYAKVVDPERYSVVFSALQFEDNARQLDAYIHSNAQYSSRR